jgi:VWFA-related protein
MARRMMISFLSAGLLAGLPAPRAAGQAAVPGATPPAPPTQAAPAAAQFPAKAEAVALDLVVRDKKGRLVTDLQAGEVEVLEDGVPQKLTSFRALEAPVAAAGGGAATGSPATATPPATTPAAGKPAAASAASPAPASRRVVLVFARLSSDGRRLAQGAGEEFARKYVSPQTVVTVVRIDGGLIPVLDATSDPAAVREGVRKATAAFGASAIPKGGPTGADNSYSGQQLSRFEGGAGARDLSQSDSISFVAALTTVVDAVKADAGRKTVLVFSEGFVVPAGYENVFAGLLSRANRSNVSFYGIDVRGLQLSSQLSSSGAALAAAAALSDQQRNAGSGTAVNREQATQDDTVQSSMRSDAVDSLQQLSTSTGGFLVTQTNDFGRPLARIAEDVRGYYEAAYTPSLPVSPGQFRKVEVRVARKDVRVQSRSGYYTTPPSASPVSAAALAALSQAELPSDFELHSRVFRFGREKDDAFDCLLKIEASLASASFKPDAQGRLTGRMALAGRVLNATGGTVETFGQEVALGGTAEQIQAARAQTLPLARRLRLAPGSYTVELVVRDTVSEKTSAQRLALTVPSPEGGLAMSSLVVVSGVDAADPKSDPSDPLLLGDKRIVPNVGRAVAPTPGAMLPVYYAAYVKPGSKPPTVTLELTRDGKVVMRGSSPTAAPDADGRITGLLPIPLQKLTAGSYNVKVTVSDGTATAEETTTVTIGS